MNDLHQLIARLKKHNSWRRGELDLTKEELDPTQIGLDIDEAIKYLEELNSEVEMEEYFDSDDFKKLMADWAKNPAPDLKIKPPKFITVKDYYN
jgi:hypothetical protein